MNKPLKQKKCRNESCRELFSPFNSMHIACSPDCIIQINRDKKSKEFNRETKRLKASIKSRGDWLREAQIAFNRFIRERDSRLPCVSCNKHHSGQYHAGHFRTVGGHPELRFHESNCHKQCAPCNNHKSGNIVEYRINLLGRIGVDQLALIEGPHEPKRYTIDDIKEIKAEYNRKFKELKDD